MKSLIYVSSIFLISIAGFFAQSELNVNFKIPNKVIAGQSFVMDLEIDKGDIANFSKLQLNLPEGFTAELLEGKTGTFTFYDQKMKLIWIALPEDPIFNVQVKISVDPSKAGSFNFAGKISYVVGSERKEKQLVSPKFSVEPNSTQTIADNSDPQTDNSGTTTSTALTTNNQNQTAEVKCVRTFDANKVAPGQTFMVSIKVNKAGISGLGKIIDNIPVGFTASELKNNGAIFSTKGNQVKFLWMTLPSEDSFEVSYKVKVDDNLDGNKVIDGKMSYLEGDETKTILIDGTSIEITNDSSTDNNTAQNTDAVSNNDISNDNTDSDEQDVTDNTSGGTASNTDNSDNTSDEGPVDNDVAQDTDNTQNNEVDNSNENTTQQNNSAVNYRVQICATRKEVNTNYFVKNHQINEHIYANMHEGWHKYTVGDFGIYTGARNHRETVKSQNKIKGPFVTAYNNGQRITVQEALMITKDKWVQ